MRVADPRRLAVVFVAVLAVVLVAVAAAALSSGPAGSPAADGDPPRSFDPAAADVAGAPENGSISIAGDADPKVVLIETGPDVSTEEIQPFVDALVADGHEVRRYDTGAGGTALNSSLRDADAYVAVAPQREYSPAAVRGVTDFADRGGRVLVFDEPAGTTAGGLLGGPVGGPVREEGDLTSLSSAFGIATGSGYLYNMHDHATNFQDVYVEPTGEGGLAAGVDRLVLTRATPVTVDADATPVATSIPRTRLSTTRQGSTFPVAARNGNAVVVGDASLLAPSNYRDADNERFVGNLASFVVTGEKEPKPEPAPGEGPETGQPTASPGPDGSPPTESPTESPTETPTETPTEPPIG